MSFPSADRPDFASRAAEVRGRVSIAAVIGGAIKLGRGASPRGKCPFHGSNSDSFAVYADGGRARCWGCGWHGDAVDFVSDFYGLSKIEALERIERDGGLDGLASAPLVRERAPVREHRGERVSSLAYGRWMWRHSVPDLDAVRTYLTARGIDGALLTPTRLADIRFVPLAPIAAWAVDGDPGDVPQAPAMVALMRRPPGIACTGDWQGVGVHATFLAPGLRGKMRRQRRDGSAYPARKMLGPAGGACVRLPGDGGFDGAAPLAVGEGIETVLSGLRHAAGGAAGGARATGIAVLSLDNLQGRWRTIGGAIPLHDPQPDFEAGAQAVAWAHDGPVTGLIDADMAPLTGYRRPGDSEPVAPLVIERKGARPVRRTISGAERSAICAALFVRAWRAKGADARAVRPPMGMDFNDWECVA